MNVYDLLSCQSLSDNAVGLLHIADVLDHPGIVTLDGIAEFSKGTIHNYNVEISYSEVVLLISMLHDYIAILEKVDDSVLGSYFRNKFARIAETLEQGIDFNYQEKMNSCRNKKIDRDDRLSENWIGA